MWRKPQMTAAYLFESLREGEKSEVVGYRPDFAPINVVFLVATEKRPVDQVAHGDAVGGEMGGHVAQVE